MLQTLSIQNIALISQLDIEFGEGFHVLTGETGAGKSIIIDAVNFVIGERVSRELIKHGESKAHVQACFSLPTDPLAIKRLNDLGIELEESTLILSRELTLNGRNTCRINGVIVTLASLKSITELLIDIHGQHDHQTLLHADQHIHFLDAFEKETIAPIKENIKSLYAQIQAVQKKLTSGFVSVQERERRMDVLQYQIEEISAANITPLEDEQLMEEYKKLSNAQQIITSLERTYALITEEESGALSTTNEAIRQMEGILALDTEYISIVERLNDAYYAMEDISYSLRALKTDFQYQPERIKAIEERLDLLHTLKRKYGATLADVVSFLNDAQHEYNALHESDQDREKLNAQMDRLLSDAHKEAAALTNARQSAAKKLSFEMAKQLQSLGMEKAQFKISISPLPKIEPHGMDHIEFLLSTNAGEPPKPLQRVASGGELSRIMLAFKTLYMGSVPTVIFDEIDTGISGHIGVVVGEKMTKIALSRQVLCITHLAQIAAMADIHYKVSKTEKNNQTISQVIMLDSQGRACELTHMIGASEQDETAMEHSRLLLEKYHKTAS